MTFKEFKQKFDYPGSIVLFGGKRAVGKADSVKLLELGKFLSENTEHIIFRTGNSSGSDFFFAEGMTDKKKLESVVPFTEYRKTFNKALNKTSLDEFSFNGEEDVITLSRLNKKTSALIDNYISGKREFYVLKCSFIIRDTVMVIGILNKIIPISFALFYDDLENPKIGGTGHTMTVCEVNSIPQINQKSFFDWVLQMR